MTAFVIQSKAQSVLVINEIDYDQPGVDSAEFIELYNPGSSPVDIGVYSVILTNCNAGATVVYDSFPLPSQILSPGAFFVICSGSGLVPNCNMTRPAVSNLIQNGSPDAVALRDSSTGLLIDAVSYEGNCLTPYIEGNGVPLAQSDTGNTPYISISRFPDGMDTNDDSTDFHRSCSTPGVANVNVVTNCGPVGIKTISAKINPEVYPNPAKGIVNIDLNGSLKNVSITLNDLLGNEMKKNPVRISENTYQLNLSEFQDGIYFVKIKSDSGNFIQRLVLKK